MSSSLEWTLINRCAEGKIDCHGKYFLMLACELEGLRWSPIRIVPKRQVRAKVSHKICPSSVCRQRFRAASKGRQAHVLIEI